MIYALIAAGIFFLDMGIKNLIEKKVPEGETKEIGRGCLLLRKHHNKGAFLNMGEKKSGFVAILSIALTLAMTVLFLMTFSFRGSRLLKSGLALLLGGAYSNTYDRLVREYVVDYVSFDLPFGFKKIIFNIGDFCIMIGALISTIGYSK